MFTSSSLSSSASSPSLSLDKIERLLRYLDPASKTFNKHAGTSHLGILRYVVPIS